MSNITLFGNAKLPAYVAGLDDEQDDFGASGALLPSLSIRGKEFRFRMNGQEQATGLRELECIVVRRRPQNSRRYFATKYSSGVTEAPTCHSADGLRPNRGIEIQAESCQQCPHSVWGSATTPDGNPSFACDTYKMLVIVPFLGDQMAAQPVTLNLPATSIKRSKKEQGNLMHAKEYFEALKKHNLPAVGAVTRIKFTSAEYPQIAFEFARFATEEEVRAAMELRDSAEVVAVIDDTNAASQEAEGPTSEAAAPVVQPKARQTVVQTKPATKPKPKPAPVVEPEEPEPVVNGVAPEDEGDAMAKVRAMLANTLRQPS